MDQESSRPKVPEPSSGISKDAKTMAMLCHLLGLFTYFIFPLVIWLTKKEEDAFIEDQSKEALNFQITMIIGWFALIIVSIITVGFGAVLFPFWGLYGLIFSIIATIKSNDAIKYRYPFALRLIK